MTLLQSHLELKPLKFAAVLSEFKDIYNFLLPPPFITDDGNFHHCNSVV